MSLNDIARTLAANVARTAGNGEKPKITLTCFYYEKYGTFDVNYKVNDSDCTLGLVDMPVNSKDTYPECREVRRLAIEELDRVIKSHYKIEREHAEMLALLDDIVSSAAQCTCHDAYKARGLTDPNCIRCHFGDAIPRAEAIIKKAEAGK